MSTNDKRVAKIPNNPVWIINGPNYLLQGDGFYISYNPDTSGGHMFTDLGNVLGAELEDGEETALVKKSEPQVYSILTGDFRDDYEKLVDKGYDACYEFFQSQKAEHGNNWSMNEEDR